MDAQQFTMVHFLPDAHGRPGALQWTSGKRSNEYTGHSQLGSHSQSPCYSEMI